jgi:hypothetical protein
MALSFFEVERGFLHNDAGMIAGVGAPSGAGDSAEVGIGSIYQDTSSGELYIKQSAGAGAANWTRLAGADEVSSSISWREPAKVIDSSATSLPTGTAGSSVTVDGQSIGDGERVLFAALTAATGPNVYIYDLASGTFSEDANNETAGDTVYVEAGTGAGKVYNYNGTDWVLTNQTNLDELGFLRAFVGKSGTGSELPDYSSENYITDGDSIETAVGKLDAQISTNASAISQEVTDRTNGDSALQSELDATQSGGGLNADGTYSASGSANYISTATSLKNADNLLDAQLKSTQDDLDALETSSAASGAKLDRARTETSDTAVTTATTVDSVSVDETALCKWIVHVQGNQAGDAAKKQVVEVLATHDGHSSADATQTDYTVYSKLRIGNVQGLQFSVDVSGSGAAQVMRLRVQSTTSCDVRAIREVTNF